MFVVEFNGVGEKVNFYTLQKEGAELSETDDFYKRILSHGHTYRNDLNMLTRILSESIGNNFGAHEKYFRFEGKASALPPNPKQVRPFRNEDTSWITSSRLRLYAYKVSDSVVVLFNGGIKLTDGAAQNDPNVSMYFHEAQQYVKKIKDAIDAGILCVSFKSLVDCSGETEVYI